jgi:hypothetical protein
VAVKYYIGKDFAVVLVFKDGKEKRYEENLEFTVFDSKAN